MIPKRKPKEVPDVDSWLMSYADMITLLLCFFVIFVSVSEPKRDKLSEITDGMSGKFGSVDYDTPFADVARALQTTVEQRRLYKDVAVESRSKSLLLEISTQKFFTGGSVDVDDAMLPVLNDLIAGLKQSKLPKGATVVIESYTDDTPPQSGLYRTNWELSAARAAKLAAYFAQQGFDPNQLMAVGYGESHPKVPNTDPKGTPIPENRAKNQRILIKME